ncbi:MAG: hypothetical protein JW765_03750 [Deltaproteobacteria bacterium]|nr:hypothetical protein [Candidatus Zymogenaceae bacterium]
MSDKIAVYIVSMGETPEAVGAFISNFSARFKIPREKMLALSKKLPVKIGSYDIEKAKQFGIEIRRMGGQVSLRRFVTQQSPPADVPPPDDGPAESWVVHGHTESQDELKSMSATDTGAPAAVPPEYDYPAMSDDVSPAFTPPPKRTIAGKYEPKQAYTADQAFGLSDEGFKKVKDLYAGRKEKRPLVGSPVFRIALIVLIIAAGVLLYQHRQEIQTLTFGLKKVVLSDAYEHRLPATISVPADLTGNYVGKLKYTTREGNIASVDVILFIERKNVHDVVVEISSSAADIGDYRLKVEYAPGYIMYTKTINNKVAYSVENTFPSSNNAVTRIDDRGRFYIQLEALDTGIDSKAIPATEKDHLGNMIFLKMEGAFAGNDQFYGGLLTSGSPLMGWEAEKK